MLKSAVFTCLMLCASLILSAQQISKADLIFLTPEWKGERFEDGRPRVSDAILERMKLVTLEEAWATLRGQNYTNHTKKAG